MSKNSVFDAVKKSIEELEKSAFIPAGPPPGAEGGGMPMDPAMMQGGGAPPPVGPDGMPMDPAMMEQMMMEQGGGMPPPPMEPGPPPDFPVEELIGAIETMGQAIEQLQRDNEMLRNEVNEMRATVARSEGKMESLMSFVNAPL